MYMYSLQDCSVANPATKMKVRLSRGEVWAADDPLVRALPHLFGKIPPVVRRTTAGVTESYVEPMVVESATAEPGVKRAVKRAGSK